MLTSQPWMKGLYDLAIERIQASEEGRDLSSVEKELDALCKDTRNPLLYKRADDLYDIIQTLPLKTGYHYVEPNTIADIHAQRGPAVSLPFTTLSEEALYDRILGAWLARCAGCLFGQPVEGWHRQRIQGFLHDTGNLPVTRYMSSYVSEVLRKKYDVQDDGGPYGSRYKNWINHVDAMPEDDDTSYTVFALKLLEHHGRDFSSYNVGEEWLASLPLLRTCTAERMAYINMANMVLPPLSAIKHNPYREWIGAQIRGDLFGYVNPGDPETAADMAFRDASISHVKNGIYGEMYSAAMIAAAFLTDDPALIIRAGMGQIPQKCRLYEKVNDLLTGWEMGITVEMFLADFYKEYDETNPHHWCHTIPNALLVTAGLLYHSMAFVPSMAFGTTAGFDTDCNSATIASVIGAAKGAMALPQEWFIPLNNIVHTCVSSYGCLAITDLARRTLALVK